MTTLAALRLGALIDAAIPFLLAVALLIGAWLVALGLVPGLARYFEEKERKEP
jgi:hypothetical protein